MKVYISGYRNHWISPYTILEKVLFWKDWENIEYETPWVQKWSDRLLPISNTIQKVLDFVHPKIDYVKIDRWDTWNMDTTLAIIILPMLEKLNAEKHGSPFVDDNDVPADLGIRSTDAPPKENEWDTDANHFKRWDWVMSELIWTFKQLHPDTDWEAQYHTGKHDMIWIPVDKDGKEVPKGEAKLFQMEKGPNDTHTWDMEGWKAHSARIDNGLLLLGKYFRCLWD